MLWCCMDFVAVTFTRIDFELKNWRENTNNNDNSSHKTMNGFIILSKSVGIPIHHVKIIPNFGLSLPNEISAMSLSALLFTLSINTEMCFRQPMQSDSTTVDGTSVEECRGQLSSFSFGGCHLQFYEHPLHRDILTVVFMDSECANVRVRNMEGIEETSSAFLSRELSHRFVQRYPRVVGKLKHSLSRQYLSFLPIIMKLLRELMAALVDKILCKLQVRWMTLDCASHKSDRLADPVEN